MRFLLYVGSMFFLYLGLLRAGPLPPSLDDAGLNFPDEIGDETSSIYDNGSGNEGIAGDMIVAAEPPPQQRSHSDAQSLDMDAGNRVGSSDQTYDIEHCTATRVSFPFLVLNPPL